jgi:hypothetical protein
MSNERCDTAFAQGNLGLRWQAERDTAFGRAQDCQVIPVLESCVADAPGHLCHSTPRAVGYFGLRWQAERDTAFVRAQDCQVIPALESWIADAPGIFATAIQEPLAILDCGGKRSATPLSHAHRTAKSSPRSKAVSQMPLAEASLPQHSKSRGCSPTPRPRSLPSTRQRFLATRAHTWPLLWRGGH